MIENFDQEKLYAELYELYRISNKIIGKYDPEDYDHKEIVLRFLAWSDDVEQVFAFGDYDGGTVDRYWAFRYKDQLYRYDATVNSWDDGNDSPWYSTSSLRPVKEYTRTEHYYE